MKIGDRVKVVRILDEDELTEEMHLGRVGVIEKHDDDPNAEFEWGIQDPADPDERFWFAPEELEVIND